MSYCFIDTPSSYSWITGAYGFLRVQTYNDSGLTANLVASCTRTTDTSPSKHNLYDLPFSHDPYTAWLVTQMLPHKSYGYSTRHTLAVSLTREDGYPLDYDEVVGVGVSPPDSPSGDMHGDPKEKFPTSDEHWLAKQEDADALFAMSQLTEGYLALTGHEKALAGKVPGTVDELRVTAELCLPRFGGPHDLPARRSLSVGVVKRGDTWTVPLKADPPLHGGVIMLSFTNPAEKSVRRQTVSVPVQLFDPRERVRIADPGIPDHDKRGHVEPPPPLAFRLTRPAG